MGESEGLIKMKNFLFKLIIGCIILTAHMGIQYAIGNAGSERDMYDFHIYTPINWFMQVMFWIVSIAGAVLFIRTPNIKKW